MKRIYESTFCLASIVILLFSFLLAACENEKPKIYTVGVINVVPNLDPTLEGFKEGMAELGYIEGENIRYIYNGPTTKLIELPEVAQGLLAAKVDLILSITTPATLAAKQATADIGIPVVFAIVTDPVEAGIVESIQDPAGHITGLAFGNQEPRRLEWLLRIAPETKRIYVPYNPKDKSPQLALQMLRNASGELGVELITREVHNQENLKAAVLDIPDEADAVFILPDSLVSTRLTDLATTAIKRHLPTSGPNISTVKEFDILTCFGVDLHFAGKQAARLVDQIFKGAKPADLPVEQTEFYLGINLKVAERIGLTIPDEILRHSNIIIR